MTFNNLSQEFVINNIPNNDTKVKFNEFVSSIDEKTEPNTPIKIEVMSHKKKVSHFRNAKGLNYRKCIGWLSSTN